MGSSEPVCVSVTSKELFTRLEGSGSSYNNTIMNNFKVAVLILLSKCLIDVSCVTSRGLVGINT
jgi:hypothetical protein